MAVQTRAQLDTKSNTVKSETAPSANTAARVGGLLEDFADSVTLNSERGLMTLIVDAPVTFATISGNDIQLEVTMNAAETLGDVFQSFDYRIKYIGTVSAKIRVAALLSFAGINNREYIFYIAKNDNVIAQSACANTTQGTHTHPAFSEAFLKADPNDEFSIYVYANVSDDITIRNLTFSAFTI